MRKGIRNISVFESLEEISFKITYAEGNSSYSLIRNSSGELTKTRHVGGRFGDWGTDMGKKYYASELTRLILSMK